MILRTGNVPYDDKEGIYGTINYVVLLSMMARRVYVNSPSLENHLSLEIVVLKIIAWINIMW